MQSEILMGKHAIEHCNITLDGNLVSDVTEYAEDVMSGTVPRISRGDYPAAMAYDRDGRLVSDSTRHIARIDYEAFGAALPRFIDMGTNSIMLRYRPDGTLAQRRHTRRYTELFTDRKGVTRERVRTDETRHTFAGSFESVSGRGWIYHFDGGYVTMTDGEAHYFARDYQGSTRAVYTAASRQIAPLTASADGAAAANGFGDETVTPRPQYNLEQATDYYPTGLPVDITAEMTDAPAASTATDMLHIGNRWINHAGLGYYDNTARYFDALTVRFTAADLLEWKTPQLSPWSHCGGNPVNFIDPSGMEIVIVGTDGIRYRVIRNDEGKYITDISTRDDYVVNALKALNSISQGLVGNTLIAILHNDTQTITIEYGDENRYIYAKNTIEWNDLCQSEIPVLKQYGVIETEPTETFVSLSHECFHAFTDIKGVVNRNIWISSKKYDIEATYDELYAVTGENFIRAEHKYNLRPGYFTKLEHCTSNYYIKQPGLLFRSQEDASIYNVPAIGVGILKLINTLTR